MQYGALTMHTIDQNLYFCTNGARKVKVDENSLRLMIIVLKFPFLTLLVFQVATDKRKVKTFDLHDVMVRWRAEADQQVLQD
jgi:hypothetical protein